MNNSKAIQQYLLSRIQLPESQAEIDSIVYALLAHFFGLTHMDVLRDKPIAISDEQLRLMDSVVSRINTHEPMQYVTGESYFYRRAFNVNSSVLIPRPETEELVQEVINYAQQKGLVTAHILDLCTGSGCIAITLALELPRSKVLATDISDQALDVARKNAEKHNVAVEFYRHDILTEAITLKNFDIIAANPPYIRESEKGSMAQNVLGFEPHMALFVHDDDPLLFYKVISGKALQALRHDGLLIVEVNEHFGHAVAELFEKVGFTQIEIVYDLSQKQRIVRGVKG